MSVHAYVLACVRTCVRVCVRARVRVCVRVCMHDSCCGTANVCFVQRCPLSINFKSGSTVLVYIRRSVITPPTLSLSLSFPLLFQEERREASAHTLSPPRAISQAESEEEGAGEMSALQKQLLTKRQSRVALKTKRVLAMMEEETVIDDPNAKVKIIKHTALEVG